METLKFTDEELGRRMNLLYYDEMYGTEMTRDRDIEEYETLLGINIRSLAVNRIKEQGRFSWVDICCGNFSASYGLVRYIEDILGNQSLGNLYVTGVDINAYERNEAPNVELKKGNGLNYPISPQTDLITSAAGLYLIEDFLKEGRSAIEHWYNSLPNGGQLVFNIDEVSWPTIVWEVMNQTLGRSMTQLITKSKRRRGGDYETFQVIQIKKSNSNQLVLPREHLKVP